jgi:putative NADH-flavin reductase
MKILIIGATGGSGRHLVTQALERGHAVTALVRNPARMSIAHQMLTVLKGDVLDSPSVDRAVAGQNAVLCALGHKRWFYPNRILSKGTENIIHAMKVHGVRRFVCQSSLGVGDSFGRLGLYYTLFTIPFILPFYYWDKGRQESVIRASDLDWTIVRPGVLNNRSPRGKIRHGSSIGSWLWTVRISRADVARFMLDQISQDTYLRQSPGVSW